MKSSVILLLIGCTQAIRPIEDVTLQVGVEADARSNIRETLKNQLRTALNRGDAYPTVILPGSTPVMPTPSAPIDMDVQIDSEAQSRMTTRQQLQEELREYFGQNGLHENSFLQMTDADMPTVAEARIQAAQMQATMDAAVAEADAKRADQQKVFEANIDKGDPAAQLQGLMNAQQSLHRLTSAFSAKPNTDKVEGMAKKLGIPMTPELMQLGSNEAISNALVEIAVGMGKTEEEISASLD
jgi:hypothetical protein